MVAICIMEAYMLGHSSSLVFLHYLTTVFDNLEEMIVLIGVEPDEKYRYLITNAAYSRITGRTESLAGRLVSEVAPPESWKLLKRHYKDVVTKKEAVEFTQTYEVPLGTQIYDIKLLPIMNAVGEVVQIAGIARNITELENLKSEVKELRGKA